MTANGPAPASSTASSERPVAFVTGGARRVGRAICLALARGGYDVEFTYNSSTTDAESLITTLRDLGAVARSHQLELADTDACGTEARRIAGTRPRWDALILSASAYTPSAIESLTAAQLSRDFAVNAGSAAMIVQAFLPGLRASSRASIVTMCDIHAMGDHGTPRRGFVSYVMSKAALLELTMALARELAPNVRVNAVAPGVVAFPESGHESDKAAQERYLSRVPMGRAGTPEEAAAAVLWLTRDATYTTGQVIRVDGGRWLG